MGDATANREGATHRERERERESGNSFDLQGGCSERVYKYREVQLELTPEQLVFHVLFEICHTKIKNIYQTAHTMLQFPE